MDIYETAKQMRLQVLTCGTEARRYLEKQYPKFMERLEGEYESGKFTDETMDVFVQLAIDLYLDDVERGKTEEKYMVRKEFTDGEKTTRFFDNLDDAIVYANQMRTFIETTPVLKAVTVYQATNL